jgi:hypothetical protein
MTAAAPGTSSNRRKQREQRSVVHLRCLCLLATCRSCLLFKNTRQIRNTHRVVQQEQTETTEFRTHLPFLRLLATCRSYLLFKNTPRIHRTSRALFLRASSHSQIRITRQPARRNVRFTSRSRAWLPLIFRRHHAARFAGHVACFGQPCQKQPSTKMASRTCRKTKSGRTANVRENFQRPTLNFERSMLEVRR